MAKAKKNEMKLESAPAKKTASKKDVGSAKPQASAPAGLPAINTSLAAESAAKLLAAGIDLKKPGAPTAAPKPESSMFKQLKSGLNKPHSTVMNNLLDKTHGPAGGNKPGSPFGNKQVGHNQTFGADVNRTGVPRRTGG